jgi:Lrp/AsnC family leucine-responsive transcriptional regulator
MKEADKSLNPKREERIELSKDDRELLAELERDSRQNFVQIAKKLGISKQLVRYRLKKLMDRNILGGFYAIINFRMLGYTSYRTMIRLSSITEQKHKEIMTYLMAHPNVEWLVECGGRWDLIANFMAKNIGQYFNFIRDIKNKFPNQIQNCDILTTIEVLDFGRDYLSEKKRTLKEITYFGRTFEAETLDGIDYHILALLSAHARMSAIQMAKSIGVSPNTVIKRIEILETRGILIGYKPLINLEKTSYSAFKALIKFQNSTEQNENEIIDSLKTDVRVIGIIRLIGLWDFEFEFEVDSRQAMRSLTSKTRDQFADVIKEFEILPLYHEYKYNFFPGDLLEQ